MTLDELMAIVSSGTTAGSTATGTNLVGRAAEERSDIRAGKREYEENLLKAEREAEEQALKDSILRMVGTAGGFALGGPAGAGLGSATMRTMFGGRDLKPVQSYTKPGMFYTETRKDIASDIRSTNEFIKRANENYAYEVAASSAGDAWTAYMFQKEFPDLAEKIRFPKKKPPGIPLPAPIPDSGSNVDFAMGGSTPLLDLSEMFSTPWSNTTLPEWLV